jgi:hypothetical protein
VYRIPDVGGSGSLQRKKMQSLMIQYRSICGFNWDRNSCTTT